MSTLAAGQHGSPKGLAGRTVVNIIGFQLCWFALVLGAAAGLWWAGALFGIAWLAFHLTSVGAQRRVDGSLVIFAACVGAAADSTLVVTGLIEFPMVSRVGPLTPPWMLVLWMCFAATLPHSLAWLARRPWIAGASGAVAGPVSYRAGEALGAISLPSGWASMAAVGVVYALATPGLAFALEALRKRHRGVLEK